MRRPRIVSLFLLLSLAALPGIAQQVLHLPPRVAAPLGVAVESQPSILVACTEVEPNEQMSNATPISVPGACSGFAASTDSSAITVNYGNGVSAGVQDLFVLNLPVGMRLNLDLTWSNTSGDLDLILFRPNGSTLDTVAVSATNGSMPESITTGTLPAGTYYIGISAFSGSSNYSIAVSEAKASGACTEDTTTVCLNNGRFRVRATYDTGTQTGNGGAVRLTPDTGYFWFFGNANVEMVVKLLDACSFNNRFWVFAGGLTDVGVSLTVTDTVAGVTKTYNNVRGTAFKPVQDTDAFSTCSAAPCTVSLTPSSLSFGTSGGAGTINVTASSSCSWTASSSASWIVIRATAGSGSGDGAVIFDVQPNSGNARSGTITVANQTATVSQSAAGPTCSFNVTPPAASYPSSGGTGSIDVSTSPGCAWTANSNASWITITGGASGSGPGTTTFSVAANSGSARSGTMTIGGQIVTISQAAAPPPSFDGTWTGPTTQAGKTISITVSGNKIMSFTLGWHADGSCSVDGTTTANFSSGVPISGNSFSLSTSGPTININGSFSSSNAGSGSFTVNFSQAFPPCSASGSGTFNISK